MRTCPLVRRLHFSKRGRRRRFWEHHKLKSVRLLRSQEQLEGVFDSPEETSPFSAPPGGPAWPGAMCGDVDAAIRLASMQEQLETFISNELHLGAGTGSPARRIWQEKDLVGSIAHEKFAASVPMILQSAAIAHDTSFRVLSLAEACGGQGEPVVSTSEKSAEASPHGSPLRFILRAGLSRGNAGPSRGNGWYTMEDLPVGCTVVAELPICCLMDAEVARQSYAQESQEGEQRALGMRLAATLATEKVGPAVHRALGYLHPPPNTRDARSCSSLPSQNAKLRSLVKAAWEPLPWLDAAERARLQMVLNLNVFRVATCDEQLSSSREYSALSGAGLYAFGAGFNHSCYPNITRYSIGPWLIFRTCRPVRAGEELCFSYLDPEVLHMSRKQRTNQLDFRCSCVRCLGRLPPPNAGLKYIVATPLVGVAAKQRIVDIFKCMQKQDFASALKQWVACSAEHVDAIVAPFEDSLIRAATQAALCAWALDAAHSTGRNRHSSKPVLAELAVRCLCVALRVHQVAFGGGAALYLKRYDREFTANLPKVWGLVSSDIVNPKAWASWQSACNILKRSARNAELVASAMDERFGFESVASEVLKWSPLVADIGGF